VKEYKDEIIFLYKVLEGCSDKSYGIHVAKLAGIPNNVINRAYQILKKLQKSASKINYETSVKSIQLELNLDNDIEDKKEQEGFLKEILEEIEKIDINNLTPIDAFNYILKWKKVINIKTQKDENTKD
ncbi:MAG: DNA mismatch repair protein MutS, partial [Endomicrobia bacterium]|nr:DNA mismatch repair protein MutS [Endomicrobiia bacterium]